MSKELERLQKRIANSGYTSRRKAETLITEGKVKVNGQTVTELGTKVKVLIQLRLKELKLNKKTKCIFCSINQLKLLQVCLTIEGRTVVTDYFKDLETRIYPVGRLDYDTSGLLLLTNDGEFTNLMTHPRYHIQKNMWLN